MYTLESHIVFADRKKNKNMFIYETHMHTAPVSDCASAGVRESVEFYKETGYDGIFITNHFLDGNLNHEYKRLPGYEDKINYYFSAYEEGQKIGAEIGLKVFCGVEMSYAGTDFLIYGLDKEWFLKHPEIMEMKKSEELPFLADNGAFVVQAHPFREAGYIGHIRLFPRCVQGVEVLNASCPRPANEMAELYADHYNLLKTAGSDNHHAGMKTSLAAMMSYTPLTSVEDYISFVKENKMDIIKIEL